MAVAQRMTEQEYRELAINDPDGFWELWDGGPRGKPGMSTRHNRTIGLLAYVLQSQLDVEAFMVQTNSTRLRTSASRTFIPELVVIPAAAQRAIEDAPLEVYADPLPLVVEVWSPSTGGYDVGTKLRGYLERGDLEIRFLHPFERTLTAWRRQADGTYTETVHTGGIVAVSSLPGAAIDLGALLDG